MDIQDMLLHVSMEPFSNRGKAEEKMLMYSVQPKGWDRDGDFHNVGMATNLEPFLFCFLTRASL